MAHKLIVDKASFSPLEYIIEERNSKDKRDAMYVTGVYAECDIVNKNKRMYEHDELQREAARYNKEMVETKRALGELNHPTKAEVDLERASHMIVELRQDGTKFVGKSQILSTPCGVIARNLIQDGCSVGFSTRSVGRLEENAQGINVVKDMRLIAVDMVADPSCPDAFVNGILESKEYILSESGDYQEVYSDFERGLRSLPRKDLQEEVQKQIYEFFQKLTAK
jgi:hypothetical protein